MESQRRCVFITGGTGYVGRPLINLFLERGHEVRALVRPGSEKKLPPGCRPVSGDALDGNSYAGQITAGRHVCSTGRGFSSQSVEGR